MATLQRPALRRTAATQPIRASFFDDSNDARNSPEAMQLREKITTALKNTPFRGPAFQLPSGAVVVEDMWAASLNTTIDEILDEGLDGLKEFANDLDEKKGWVGKWLKHKVSLEGKDQDKYYYEALARKLWPHKYDTDTPTPNPPQPNPIPAGGPYRSLETPADFIRAGLPMNMTDIQHQPLREVEVYRDLGGFEMPEDPEGEEDEKKAEDDDMAEGA
jgi:hypothetical protein